MEALVNATTTLIRVAHDEGDSYDSVKDRINRLVEHITEGGDMRLPPIGWRATFANDDIRNEPDMWIADLGNAIPVWCKMERHTYVATVPGRQAHPRPGLEMFKQYDRPPCGWCGVRHGEDVMNVFTFMLPEDY